MVSRLQKLNLFSFVIGGIFCVVLFLIIYGASEATSTDTFCLSCHEMKYVNEKGYMLSKHFGNKGGVTAACRDCHIPPGVILPLYTKARDGLQDLFVHYLGETDPEKMDFAGLAELARSKIKDTSCLKCHRNLLPADLSIDGKVQHRSYLLLKNRTCMDCHKKYLHTPFVPQEGVTR